MIVGDRVRIVRQVFDEDGWSNSWNSDHMDAYVNNGRTYTIASIGPAGVRFAGIYYGWPPGALEVVPTAVFAGGDAPPARPNRQPYEGEFLPFKCLSQAEARIRGQS